MGGRSQTGPDEQMWLGKECWVSGGRKLQAPAQHTSALTEQPQTWSQGRDVVGSSGHALIYTKTYLFLVPIYISASECIPLPFYLETSLNLCSLSYIAVSQQAGPEAAVDAAHLYPHTLAFIQPVPPFPCFPFHTWVLP